MLVLSCPGMCRKGTRSSAGEKECSSVSKMVTAICTYSGKESVPPEFRSFYTLLVMNRLTVCRGKNERIAFICSDDRGQLERVHFVFEIAITRGRDGTESILACS